MTSIIEDLQDPAALPDETASVAVVQTHISMVFVGDEFVYKVKKPVDFGFLDFSTLDKRAHFCRQEVALNRRLAEDIYLDVLPVTFDGKRHRLTGGGGEVVDYAVRMRRIPDTVLMKSLFERGELTPGHLEKVADRLSRFHSTAATGPDIAAFGEPDRFKVNTDENFQQIRKYIGVSIQKAQYDALREWTGGFFRDHASLFHQRIEKGKIRDCHGDLHMEHVCFTENLSIIDCIEFNERFRYSDTLADVAFLLMDLEYHGGKDAAARLWAFYSEASGDRDDALLTFYKVYRAVVRGKVNSFQVDDTAISEDEKQTAVQTAARYFDLACSYIA